MYPPPLGTERVKQHVSILQIYIHAKFLYILRIPSNEYYGCKKIYGRNYWKTPNPGSKHRLPPLRANCPEISDVIGIDEHCVKLNTNENSYEVTFHFLKIQCICACLLLHCKQFSFRLSLWQVFSREINPLPG